MHVPGFCNFIFTSLLRIWRMHVPGFYTIASIYKSFTNYNQIRSKPSLPTFCPIVRHVTLTPYISFLNWCGDALANALQASDLPYRSRLVQLGRDSQALGRLYEILYMFTTHVQLRHRKMVEWSTSTHVQLLLLLHGKWSTSCSLTLCFFTDLISVNWLRYGVIYTVKDSKT